MHPCVLVCPLLLLAPSPPAEEAPTAPASLKTYVQPAYPVEGRRLGVGGIVTLRLEVGEDGRVREAALVRGIGAAFDRAALAAARKLEFHPARSEGRPVASTVTFEYRFDPPGHTHAEPAAHPTSPPALVLVETVDEVRVVDDIDRERPLTAASARTVRDRDLRLRPLRGPEDLLRVAPGLAVVQHAGGGKAMQWLLRGFDADHGTDVALSFDGVPINMVSHAHGQGYADVSFVIPELVERVEVAKGPYFAERGDFATAGAVDLVTREAGESAVSLGGGSFGTLRAVGIAAPAITAGLHPLLAAEVMRTDGPFEHPENFQKRNLYGKLTWDLAPRSDLALAMTSYTGSWNASGQIPLRAVQAGAVGFFGALDPSEGGTSSRHGAYARLRLRPDAQGEWSALAYHTLYDLTLHSNFTFFAVDPEHGDQIEQRDERTVTGARLAYRWMRTVRGVLFDTTVGGDARADAIRNGLHRTRARERLATVVDADVRESAVGAYLREDVQPWSWLRVIGALRADHFAFQVSDRLEDLAALGAPTSGARGAGIVTPKAAVVLSPHPTTDLFVNYGEGFHSNDARGVVRAPEPVTPLTRARGYEIGARTRLLAGRLEAAVALWRLDLASEIVWVGDEGTTEAAGATRRMGADLEVRLQILPWLHADADVMLADARFRENAGNAGAVALAPRLVIAGGLAALHPRGVRAALRGLHLAERPATEDRFLTAQATTLVDLLLAYRRGPLELALDVENLLDRRHRGAQFATVTRLPGEPPTDAPPPPAACPAGTRAAIEEASGHFRGCEDLSFSPGHPLSFRLTATYFF